jgi:hypothetical protein
LVEVGVEAEAEVEAHHRKQREVEGKLVLVLVVVAETRWVVEVQRYRRVVNQAYDERLNHTQAGRWE